MAKKRKNIVGRIIGFIVFLLIVYIALATLDFLGVFIMGNYESDLGVVKREIGVNGATDEEKITWRSYGDEFYLYRDGKEYATGTIQNGVITYHINGADVLEITLYKNGNKPSGEAKKGFIDYFRLILKPATKLMGKIAG